MARGLFFILMLASVFVHAQPRTDARLRMILDANQDSLFQRVLNHPEEFRYQIIYTEINRDKKNRPRFKNYYLNVESLAYFNPASTVKLPLAILSLEKLHELRKHGLDMHTPMQFDSSRAWHRTLYQDSTSPNGLPSIAHFIRKALLVSDNDAYNRMYQFVGQQETNRRLQQMGYTDLRITRQFMGLTPEQNRYTNPIRFVREDRSLIWQQPEAYNPDPFDFSHINRLGIGYLNAKDSLVNEPIDFTFANNLTVAHLQGILQALMFPKDVPANMRFNLDQQDLDFLYRYLSQYPSESDDPKYDTAKFYDSYVKFFFRDESHAMPPQVRVFNKVGWAYGCLTDVSYVADFTNKVEFILTATIYVNADGILNDDKYEYEEVGWPFLYQLGQTIYRYELQRKRTHRPDLRSFEMKYVPRRQDKRTVIKEVDN
ncbi:MAG: serine hydrolase [Chitinophagaceae bacterium]